MLKDGCAEKSFLHESQDAAACAMGGPVGDTAERGPMGLTPIFCQGPRVEKKEGGEVTVRATFISTLQGLHQPQGLKHFSSERSQGSAWQQARDYFYLFRKNLTALNSLKIYFGICSALFGLCPLSFLSYYYLLSHILSLILRQTSKRLPPFS